jgi:ABC-2 type transport system permease protein/sodium transport system permease protein
VARGGDDKELDAALRGGELDLILRPLAAWPPDQPPGRRQDQVFDFAVEYLPSSPGGLGALSYLETRLAAANEWDLTHRLNVPKAQPIEVLRIARTPLEERAGARSFISLASLVPLILIMMTITGAVYPAIDLTAGERERGTLEILVAAPVPRLGLLFAKYVSVWTVAVLTALVNLTAMTLTLVLSGLGPMLLGERGLTLGLVVQLFALLLLFAAFFSAVLLCITSFARSFKEAQAYLIPLMLASLGPGVLAMMPGLALERWAVTPLLNIVLLGRDLFDGNATLTATLLVVASTLMYALAAIGLAARVFGDESVLYNEQSSWGDLFRRAESPQPAAGISAALWCLAIMIPVSFVMRGAAMLLVQAGFLGIQQQILIGPIYALVLFGLLPLPFAWHGHLRVKTAFALQSARPVAYLGAAVLGAALWPVVFGLMLLAESAGLSLQGEHVSEVAQHYRGLPAGVKILLVVAPALLEEWFFRGYLYGALRARVGGLGSICLTALAFGLMHYLLSPGLSEARILSAALMGLALGAVREVSGSVLPGMLLHGVYNSALVLLLGGEADAVEHVEPWWVVAGAIASVVGAGLVCLGRRVVPSAPPGGEGERLGTMDPSPPTPLPGGEGS